MPIFYVKYSFPVVDTIIQLHKEVALCKIVNPASKTTNPPLVRQTVKPAILLYARPNQILPA